MVKDKHDDIYVAENFDSDDEEAFIENFYAENIMLGFTIDQIEFHLMQNGYSEKDFKEYSKKYKRKLLIDRLTLIFEVLFFSGIYVIAVYFISEPGTISLSEEKQINNLFTVITLLVCSFGYISTFLLLYMLYREVNISSTWKKKKVVFRNSAIIFSHLLLNKNIFSNTVEIMTHGQKFIFEHSKAIGSLIVIARVYLLILLGLYIRYIYLQIFTF